MKARHYIFLTLLITCFFTTVQAQKGNSQLEREMMLEREYNPSLRDANKINQLPQVKEPEAPKTKVEFSNFLLDYNIPPYLSNLKAQSYFSDYAVSNKRGYLNAGVSSLLDIDGDLGYQILNLAKDRLSIYYSHRSSNSNVTYLQKDENQKMKINDNIGGIDYAHTFEKVKFFADAQYTYSAFNYYGSYFDIENWSAADNSVKQNNNMFQAHLGVASIETDNKLNYKANIAYTYFKQKYGIYKQLKGKNENRFMGDLDLNTRIGSASRVGVAADVIYYSYKTPFNNFDNSSNSHKNSYTTLSAKPYISFTGDNWNTQLGASANFQFGDAKETVIAPNIYFNWYPSENVLVYLSATGGIKDNSNYSIYYENRYTNPIERIADSKIPVDGTIGTKITILPNFGIGIFGGYKVIKDEHFYYSYGFSDLAGLIMRQSVSPMYADANVFKIGGDIEYAYQDLFDINIKLCYYNWDVKKKEIIDSFMQYKAWNKPTFTSDVNLGFKVPAIPLRLDVNYHLETGRKSLISHSFATSHSMKDIHNLSAKVNYALNDSFSVFAQANNLLFQKYDIWYGYPAQKFNIMGGLSIKF